MAESQPYHHLVCPDYQKIALLLTMIYKRQWGHPRFWCDPTLSLERGPIANPYSPKEKISHPQQEIPNKKKDIPEDVLGLLQLQRNLTSLTR
jgi:hypothetical protein